MKNLNSYFRMLGLATLGFIFLQLGAYSAGIVMFAYYSDKGCGPLAGKEINSPNQVRYRFFEMIHIQ